MRICAAGKKFVRKKLAGLVDSEYSWTYRLLHHNHRETKQMRKHHYERVCQEKRESSEPLIRTDDNDCVVKAMAIVSGKSYEECWKACRKKGRKHGKGFYTGVAEQILRDWGFITQVVRTGAKTLKSLPKLEGRYLIQNGGYTNSHLSAMVDGQIEDWADGRRKRVKMVIKVWREETPEWTLAAQSEPKQKRLF